MSHSPITQLPRFPGPLSPSLAWQAWKTAAFDAAAVPIQGHLHGLLGFILTPAEYQALAGEAFAPFEHPQVFAAEANLFPIWKYEAEIFYVQCAALASFKQLLLSSLDPTAIAVVADPEGSTATATPRHILATLFAAYGSPLPEEVNSQRLSLMIPYSMEVPIRAHILHGACLSLAGRRWHHRGGEDLQLDSILVPVWAVHAGYCSLPAPIPNDTAADLRGSVTRDHCFAAHYTYGTHCRFSRICSYGRRCSLIGIINSTHSPTGSTCGHAARPATPQTF